LAAPRSGVARGLHGFWLAQAWTTRINVPSSDVRHLSAAGQLPTRARVWSLRWSALVRGKFPDKPPTDLAHNPYQPQRSEGLALHMALGHVRLTFIALHCRLPRCPCDKSQGLGQACADTECDTDTSSDVLPRLRGDCEQVVVLVLFPERRRDTTRGSTGHCSISNLGFLGKHSRAPGCRTPAASHSVSVWPQMGPNGQSGGYRSLPHSSPLSQVLFGGFRT